LADRNRISGAPGIVAFVAFRAKRRGIRPRGLPPRGPSPVLAAGSHFSLVASRVRAVARGPWPTCAYRLPFRHRV